MARSDVTPQGMLLSLAIAAIMAAEARQATEAADTTSTERLVVDAWFNSTWEFEVLAVAMAVGRICGVPRARQADQAFAQIGTNKPKPKRKRRSAASVAGAERPPPPRASGLVIKALLHGGGS